MGKLKNKRVADILLDVLENEQDGWVRSGAAIDIGEMPWDERLSMALLRASMDDCDWRVRGEAAEAMGKMIGK